jgi:hypothetical protein
LLQDAYSVHAKEENITILQCTGVEVELIPAGYTAVLQVLDKGVHRTFKHFYRENCINWLTQQQQQNQPVSLLHIGLVMLGSTSLQSALSTLGTVFFYIRSSQNKLIVSHGGLGCKKNSFTVLGWWWVPPL